MASVSITAREYRGGFSGDSRSRYVCTSGAALEAPAARDLHELDLAAGPVRLERVEQLAHRVGGQRRLEQLRELRDGHRLAGDEQRRFEDALDLASHGSPRTPRASTSTPRGRRAPRRRLLGRGSSGPVRRHDAGRSFVAPLQRERRARREPARGSGRRARPARPATSCSRASSSIARNVTTRCATSACSANSAVNSA